MSRKKRKEYWKRELIRCTCRKITNYIAVRMMEVMEQEILYGSSKIEPIGMFASRQILTIGSSRGRVIRTPILWDGILHEYLPTSGFNIEKIGDDDAGT